MKQTLPDDREDFEAKDLPGYKSPGSKPDGGRFDDDVYSRARAYVESSESTPKAKPARPKSAAKAAPAPAPKPTPKAETPAPAPAPKAAPKSDEGDEYSGLARLKRMFGTQEQRESVEKDIKASDIAAAKKAGEERRARDRETFFDPLKRLAARIGPAETREKYKAQGYAKGGSVGSASRRADGCAQRGKTKGRIV